MNNRHGDGWWLPVLGKTAELAVTAVVAGASSTVKLASLVLLGFLAVPGSPRGTHPVLCGCIADAEADGAFSRTQAQL